MPTVVELAKAAIDLVFDSEDVVFWCHVADRSNGDLTARFRYSEHPSHRAYEWLAAEVLHDVIGEREIATVFAQSAPRTPRRLSIRERWRCAGRLATMDYRALGRTGIQVSPLCLGAMMFGAVGQPRPRRVDPDHPRARSTRASTSSTPPTSTRAGESEEIVGKALAGGRRDDVVLATKVHGPMGDGPEPSAATRAAGSSARSRTSLRRLRHRLDRPLPGAPPRPGHRHRGDARRAHRPRARRARSARSAPRRSRRTRSSRRSGSPSGAGSGASSPSSRRTRCSCAGSRRDVLPVVPALRHGRARVEPAGRRLADRPLPQGPGRPRRPARRARIPGRYDLSLPGEPAQARRGRGARASSPTRPGCTLIQLAIAFVARAPGGHRRRSSARARWSSSRASSAPTTSTLDDAVLDRIDEIVPPGTNLNPRRRRLHAAGARGQDAATPQLAPIERRRRRSRP